MINRITSLFSRSLADDGSVAEDEIQIASAALLVEAACMDGEFDSNERQRILYLIVDQFNLNKEEGAILIKEAEKLVDQAGDLYAFTRIVKDKYSMDQRVKMIEMLWEVAFADGKADHYEKNLISRVAGLIFVSDKDRGEARKRVLARLGIE